MIEIGDKREVDFVIFLKGLLNLFVTKELGIVEEGQVGVLRSRVVELLSASLQVFYCELEEGYEKEGVLDILLEWF